MAEMTEQERQALEVLMVTVPQLPPENRAYLMGYAQAMADQNKEKEQRPA